MTLCEHFKLLCEWADNANGVIIVTSRVIKFR